MKAGIASPNGVVIQDVTEPKPEPDRHSGARCKAVALNRADLGSARGDTSHGASGGRPIGSEFAGEVVEVGARCATSRSATASCAIRPAATPSWR